MEVKMLNTTITGTLYIPTMAKTKFRSAVHLGFVRQHPCIVCGSDMGVEAHHIRKRKPGHLKSIGSRVSDEFTVPLCHDCHTLLHQPNRSEDWFWENCYNGGPFEEAKKLFSVTMKRLGIKDAE